MGSSALTSIFTNSPALDKPGGAASRSVRDSVGLPRGDDWLVALSKRNHTPR